MAANSIRIDLKRLRLVIPIYDEAEHVRAWVYAQPISTEVLDAHFLVIAKTFASMYAEGIGMIAGPQVAASMLRETAQGMGRWESVRDPDDPKRILKPGVKEHLVGEIRRLATVLVPGDRAGWDQVMLDDALKLGLLDETDAREVDNAITFFTVASRMHRKQMLLPMLVGAMELWGAEIRSCSCVEFANSLTASTEDANSGVTAAA